MNYTEAEAARLVAAAGQGQSVPAKPEGPLQDAYDEEFLPKEFDFYWELFGAKGYFEGVYPESEVQFCKGRKWRFDRAFVAERLAVECDGHCHRTKERWAGDIEKFKLLRADGLARHPPDPEYVGRKPGGGYRTGPGSPYVRETPEEENDDE